MPDTRGNGSGTPAHIQESDSDGEDSEENDDNFDQKQKYNYAFLAILSVTDLITTYVFMYVTYEPEAVTEPRAHRRYDVIVAQPAFMVVA